MAKIKEYGPRRNMTQPMATLQMILRSEEFAA